MREAIVQVQGERDGSGERVVEEGSGGVEGLRVGDLISEAAELIEEVRVEL